MVYLKAFGDLPLQFVHYYVETAVVTGIILGVGAI